MIKKTLASLLSLIVISAISVTGAEAATTSPTATVGGICVKAGAVTSIAGKSYTCIKVLSGKLVWALTSTTTAAKPQVSGGAGGEGEGGTGENQGGGNAARQAILKKYNTCLVAHGGIAILDTVGVKQGDDGAKLKTPPAKPTQSAVQKAAQKVAVTACLTLAPKARVRASGGGDN